ncbi:hypothetical protein [Pseudoalteromonas citrea]|nr:hypothetical protein [Pseudoalteromonas citrea]
MRYVIFILMLSGCTSVVVSDADFAKNINQKCFSVEKPLNIYRFGKSTSNPHIVFTEESKSTMPIDFDEKYELVGTLSTKELIKIIEIVDYPYGSAGRCWKIYAVSKKHNGKKFELPSCWMDHTTVWFSPHSISRVNINQKIELVTDSIKPSEECI